MSGEKNEADIPKENADSEKTALTMADEVNKTQSAAAMMDDGPELDQSKVKFINGVDAAVDLGKKVDVDDDCACVGLTKTELMQYAKDPYWVRLRMVLLVCFWLAWFAMLAAAIIIIVLAPKCPHRPNLEWWQKSVGYQVYPRTFQDTNNDGVGDLQGVENHLSYLRTELNVSVVHLNAFYPSGGKDGGYDITDYKDVDKELGSLTGFHNLVNSMHRKGIKLIIDIVPNHVSNMHAWFNESRKNPSSKYNDYFVWANSTNSGPPNNWKSVFGGSAWTFDQDRKAYYYHTFLSKQPDLNLRNPDVVAEIKDVFTFWLDQNVDGFHVRNAQYLVEGDLNGDGQTFQPESYELITQFKEVVAKYTKDTEKYKFMSVEVSGSINQTLPFYGYMNKEGADMPLNTALAKLGEGGPCGGACVFDKVHTWLGLVPDYNHKWSSWVLGDQDVSRVATRMGDDMVNAVNMLHMTLPGTPFAYYGQEIGMQDNTAIPIDQSKDIYVPTSRDPQRTPMQWTGGNNAGFSNGTKLYLPVNADYKSRNVRVQMAHGSGDTNVEVFQSLTLLRQEPSFQWGSFYDLYKDENIFCFVRQAEGFDGFLVAINFGPNTATPDFHRAKPNVVPSEGVIVGHTHNFVANSDEFVVGTKLPLDQIHLSKGQGVVFKWAWDDRPQQES